MAVNHGIYITQQGTPVSTPNTADVSIPFIVGAAPLDTAKNPATVGLPVLCTSYEEAVEQLGWSDDWKTYPVCEFIYSHFKLFGCQPMIINPMAKDAAEEEVNAGIEAVDLCMSMYGIVPDLLVAPGYSNNSVVAAAMSTKAKAINGMFLAKALVDIDGNTYTEAITNKSEGSFDQSQIVCWPCVKLGSLIFHMSTIIAGRMAATDSENNGIPYETPSNKKIGCDGLCLADGTVLVQSKAQADALVDAGIVTALNFMGSLVVWGNYTGCYPESADVKDYFIPISRMFGFVNNTIIQTYWSYIDKPMTRRLLDTILDSVNIWLNGLVGSGYLLGARCEMNESENTLTDLMAGKIKLHIYLTPPSPMQELDFVLEYDAEYVESAFSS